MEDHRNHQKNKINWYKIPISLIVGLTSILGALLALLDHYTSLEEKLCDKFGSLNSVCHYMRYIRGENEILSNSQEVFLQTPQKTTSTPQSVEKDNIDRIRRFDSISDRLPPLQERKEWDVSVIGCAAQEEYFDRLKKDLTEIGFLWPRHGRQHKLSKQRVVFCFKKYNNILY